MCVIIKPCFRMYLARIHIEGYEELWIRGGDGGGGSCSPHNVIEV